MSKPRLMQTLPSLDGLDYERSVNHRCAYEYNPPKRSDTLGMLWTVDHRSTEWTNGGQDGRLPSLAPSATSLYPIDPDSRLQPVHLGKDGSHTRGYQPFGGTPDSSRPQLPSVSDILKTNSQPQHSYHRPPSAHTVGVDPFERYRSEPSSFLSGVARDERARPHTSPSSNGSAPSSMSCELESLGDSPGSEMPKGTSTSRQHTIRGPDVEDSFRRRDLRDLNEGNPSSHSDSHGPPVSARNPPQSYSREGSGGEPAPLMAAVGSSHPSTAKDGEERGDLNNHRAWSGDSHDSYESLDHKRVVALSCPHSGRELEGNQNAVSVYPATPGTTYRSNQGHEPTRQQRLPQLREAFGTQRCMVTDSMRNNSNRSIHPQAEDKLSSLIWDGNRFLPRLIRTETVPGKGLCYFYDDGSYCKAKIDGEDVNPSWGVTKAGKPRKRLAVACITCREKKIKCDPDYPKCKQCVKFDRVCTFKNAARAAQILKETCANSDNIGDIGDASQFFQASRSGQRMDTFEDSPTRIESTISKKRKPILKFDTREFANGYNQLFMEGGLSLPSKRHRAASPATVLKMLSGALGSGGWSGEFDWETDPYEAYPKLVDHLMDLYFKHINTTIYCMFPRKPFRKWLKSGEKSPDDRMLIYAMLTLASRFSTDPDRKTIAKNLQTTAKYAIEHRHGKFSLQLVQSRLAFSLYCFAANNSNEAYEYSGAGIRAALAMKLNVDNGASDFPDDDTFEYGLNRHAIAECRRRTFWSAYLMDRFNGFSSGRAGLISNDDIFVRLPCHDKLFDSQEEVSNPFFDKVMANNTDLSQSGQEHVNLGPMAFLIEVSCIWGDVLAEIYRSANRPNGSCATTYEAFYSKTQHRLSRWLTDLPLDLVYTEENMSLSSKSGHLGSFLTMHSLYHATMMKLNRYARLEQLSRERIIENLLHLDKHAREQLQMMIRFRHGFQLEEPLGTPFTGYATSSACDILSAKVPRDKLSEILELLSQGLSVLESLQNHWHTSRKQKSWMSRRIERLEKSESGHLISREDAEGADGSHSLTIVECIPQPMEAPICAVDDIPYSVDQDIYREALINQPHIQNNYDESREASISQKASSPPSVLESGDEKEPEEKG